MTTGYEIRHSVRTELRTPALNDVLTRELENSLPRLAYFPFSAGPRRCIGDRFATLEARLLVATIYQNYHLELVSDRNLEVIPTVTSRPKEDVVMVAHERSNG